MPTAYIDFVARGLADVGRAFKSVGDAVVQGERDFTNVQKAEARKRAQTAKDEAREKAQMYRGLFDEIARREKQQGQDEKKAKAESAQADKTRLSNVLRSINAEFAARKKGIEEFRRLEAAAAKQRASDQAAAAKQRASAEAAEERAMIRRIAQGKAAHRAEERERRAADRGAAREQSAADRQRARERAEIERGLSRERRAASRAEQNAEREQFRAMGKMARGSAGYADDAHRGELKAYEGRKRFGASVIGAGASAIRQTGALIGSGVRRTAGALFELGGGFSIVDSVREESEFQRSAAVLSNQTNIPGEGARVPTEKIMSTAKAAAIRNNMDPNDMIEGLRGYVARTGKPHELFNDKDAAKNIDYFAKVAKTNATPIADVMRTAGTLRVQNPSLDPAGLNKLLLGTVRQARKGSIEFEDMARMGGIATKTSTAFAGDQSATQSRLLGLAQISMPTAGSAREAGTAVSSVISDALNHTKKIQKKIGKFTDANDRINVSPDELIARVMEQTGGGGIEKLKELGFGKFAQKTFLALGPEFQKAKGEALASNPSLTDAQANAAGKAGVLKHINEISAGDYSEKDLNEDFANLMKSSAEQFEQAVRGLKQMVATELLPEFVKLIPVLKELTPQLKSVLEAFRWMVEFIKDNPLKGLAAAIGIAFSKELAAAQLPNLLSKLFAGPAPGGGAGVVGNALTGVGGKAGAGTGVGAGGAATGGAGVVGAAAALTVAAVATEADDVIKARRRGAERGRELSKAHQEGDPAAYAEIKKLKEETGWVDTGAAYATKGANIGAAVLAAPAYFANKGVSWGLEAAGLETADSRANSTLEKKATLDVEQANTAALKLATVFHEVAERLSHLEIQKGDTSHPKAPNRTGAMP